MAKTYLATKDDLDTVKSDVDTLSNTVTTPSTGLNDKVASLESAKSAQDTTNTNLQSAIDDVDDKIENESTGLKKRVSDVETEIDQAGTGIKARLDELEQGGTTTTKFRTHSSSGVYEDGEVVERNGSLYRANSAIDGSTSAVTFSVGSGANTWSPVSAHPFERDLVVSPPNSNIRLTGTASNSGVILAGTDSSSNAAGIVVLPERGRVTLYNGNPLNAQAEITNNDLLTKSDADSLYASGGLGTVVGVHKFDTMPTNYSQYDLGTTACQLILRKVGTTQLDIGIDADSRNSENPSFTILGSMKVINRSAGLSSGTSEGFNIDRPIAREIDQDSGSGIHRLELVTVSNYFWCKMQLSVALDVDTVAGVTDDDDTIQVFDITITGHNQSSTENVYSVAIARII